MESSHLLNAFMSGQPVERILSNPRQEKGTMKVDPHEVQGELCTALFAHRAVLAKIMTDDDRRIYLESTMIQDEDLVKKAGRDVANMKVTGAKRATSLLAKRERQRELDEFETKAKGLLTLIENMKKTEAEDQANDTDGEDSGNGRRSGTPGAPRATRNGLGTKRKHEEEELARQVGEMSRMVKIAKPNRRQS